MTMDEEDEEGEQLDKGKGKGGQFIGDASADNGKRKASDDGKGRGGRRRGERGDEANEVQMTRDDEDAGIARSMTGGRDGSSLRPRKTKQTT
mgnify:CR=1 FL=1